MKIWFCREFGNSLCSNKRIFLRAPGFVMSTVLHLDLKRTTIATAELWVFTSNPNVYESRSLNLSEVEDLVAVMEQTVKVAARRTFVGRRRVLQAGLRSVRQKNGLELSVI